MTEVQTVQDDWNFLIEKIQAKLDITHLDDLKQIPIQYIENLHADGTETVAEINFDKNGLSLYVGEVYFELSAPYAIMSLLHELCHALIVTEYIYNHDIKGLYDYYLDNGGHTKEWNTYAKQIKSLFPNVPNITVSLDLSDDSIYEN